MKATTGIILALIAFAQAQTSPSTTCKAWTSIVDPSIGGLEPGRSVEKLTNEEKVQAIACLMTLKGQKGKARFGGVTRPDVSQIFPECSVEVGALFYIGYIYYGRWDYCDAIALTGEESGWNIAMMMSPGPGHPTQSGFQKSEKSELMLRLRNIWIRSLTRLVCIGIDESLDAHFGYQSAQVPPLSTVWASGQRLTKSQIGTIFPYEADRPIHLEKLLGSSPGRKATPSRMARTG